MKNMKSKTFKADFSEFLNITKHLFPLSFLKQHISNYIIKVNSNL